MRKTCAAFQVFHKEIVMKLSIIGMPFIGVFRAKESKGLHSESGTEVLEAGIVTEIKSSALQYVIRKHRSKSSS